MDHMTNRGTALLALTLATAAGVVACVPEPANRATPSAGDLEAPPPPPPSPAAAPPRAAGGWAPAAPGPPQPGHPVARRRRGDPDADPAPRRSDTDPELRPS